MKTAPLRFVADVRSSSVDKHTHEGEVPVQLCNYVDVYRKDVVLPGPDLMRATATREELNRFRLQVGDTVLTKDSEDPAEMGISAYIEQTDDDFVCGYHLAIARPADGTHPKFLTWALRSRPVLDHFSAHSSGISRYGLSLSGLRSTPIPIKDWEEQRRIADFLDDRVARIDQIITARSRQAELAQEAYRATLSQHFDELADGRVSLRYLLSQRASYGLLPDQVSDDPDLPRYIRTTDIDNFGGLRSDTFVSVDRKFSAEYGVKPGDVLIARSGTIGRATVITEDCDAVFAGYLIRLRFQDLSPWAFWYFTQTHDFADQLAVNAVQSTILNFNAERYASVTLPDIRAEQATFLELADEQTRQTRRMRSALSRATELLTEYKQSLITAAVSGELDVSTAGSRIPGEGGVQG